MPQVALGNEQGLRVRPVEVGALDRAAEIGDEHAAVPRIQSQADPFHQVRKDDLGSISTPNAITLFVLSWSGE